MIEYLKHKTTTFIFIITLCGMSILAVKTLNIIKSNNKHDFYSEGYPHSYIGQDAAGQRAIQELPRFPDIEQITASPDTLWTADKQMVPISLNVVAESMTGWRIIRVEKNEPEYGIDGDHDGPDAIFVGQMLKLRAERNRSGATRIYTVYLRVYKSNTDGSQNSTLVTVEVEVPGSQVKGQPYAT